MNTDRQQAEKYFIEEYQVQRMIGSGGQANVYLASKDHNLYAIKVYLSGVTRDQAFRKEVDCLQKLRFQYLINMVEFRTNARVRVDDYRESSRNIIVLQYAESLDLFEYVSKQGKFQPSSCKRIFKQLLQTIQFINSKNICHRDLKCENILLDKDFNLKISDFGLAAISLQGDEARKTRVGTQGFRSPQIQQGKSYDGLEIDIFAAGVILFMMYAGSPPFLSTKHSDNIYRMIYEGNYQKFWDLHSKKREKHFFPVDFKRLMNSFFSYDPSKRPTLQSLKNDPWLNSVETSQPHHASFELQMQTKLHNILQMDENIRNVNSIVVKFREDQRIEAQIKAIECESSYLTTVQIGNQQQESLIDSRRQRSNRQAFVKLNAN